MRLMLLEILWRGGLGALGLVWWEAVLVVEVLLRRGMVGGRGEVVKVV